jgi:hypothetical protein
MIKLSDIRENPDNPRYIESEELFKLCESIKSFPKMMELRPIVIDDDGIILGGNMRYRALKELGYKEVANKWIINAKNLTEEQKREFIIKDNVSFGEWDQDLLQDWDKDELSGWGADIVLKDKLSKLDEGEEIEFPNSIQVEPPKEYILITADPNSKEWEEIKEMLKLKMVKRGGYKKGSAFNTHSIERVLDWKDFKKRIK